MPCMTLSQDEQATLAEAFPQSLLTQLSVGALRRLHEIYCDLRDRPLSARAQAISDKIKDEDRSGYVKDSSSINSTEKP